MGQQVCMNALLQCSQGVAPSPLMVLPANKVSTIVPDANIMDHVPLVNILPFVMCQSMSNPMVMAATAAAMGAKTPMPCIPATTSPWSPGCKTVKIAGQLALNNSSKLDCIWGGKIEIKFAGQMTVNIP